MPLAPTREPDPYEIIEQRDVMVAMRDGVRLATNLYVPGRDGAPAAGRFPAVVRRTPYGKDFTLQRSMFWRRLTPAGYVVVVQDVRGRFGSGGRWNPLRDDGADGADLLAWIAAQPWSNGKVGTVGTSYDGAVQHALAIEGAPALAAMIPVDAMSNPGRYGMRNGGAMELRWLSWVLSLGNAIGPALTPDGRQTGAVIDGEGRPTGRWLMADGTERTPAESPDLAAQLAGAKAALDRLGLDEARRLELEALGHAIRQAAKALPLQAGATALRHAPDYEIWLVEALAHGDNDGFWTDMGFGVLEHLERYQDTPTIHVTGAYDSWAVSVANLTFPALSKAKQSPQRLLFGPWTHGQQALSYAGIAEFGPAAALDMPAIQMRWFDRWLKDEANGAEADAPVRIFVMGGGDGHRTPEGRLFVGGHWRDAATWPPPDAAATPFYLQAGGGLSAQAPGDAPPTSYRFDPRHPVPSIGGNVSSQRDLMLAGAHDQVCRPGLWPCEDDRPLTERSDVLVFQSEPLTAPLQVIGPITVQLWASSDGPDTDFTAKLIDVWPPSADFPESAERGGVALNIGDGIIRARYRASWTAAAPLERGRAYAFEITLNPTALVFGAGHRIRVDISSSNFPRFDVNPNTGEPLNANTSWRVATNTVFHDAEHPSRIMLPVVAM
ncbi:MAG TPA: CocE/NonD family hydrolase [Caulobacteraceae bacterium]|nr:CocE/NonD family hydrolase [Caulobacteraceae bacterium]